MIPLGHGDLPGGDSLVGDPTLRRQPVLVQGPGAIGRLIATRFARAGIAVELLGRGEAGAREFHLHEGRCHGGDSPSASVTLPVGSVEDDPDPRFALLVVTTKAYDVREALSTGVRHLGPGAAVLILANGLGHDESLDEQISDAARLLGTISCGARAEGKHSVHALGEGPVQIGPSRGESTSGVVAEVCALFHRAGFSAETVEDGRAAQWAKAALNCGLNPVAALLGVPNGEVPSSPYFRWAVDAARETATVGRASGVCLPERGWRRRLADLCAATASNRCSMLQDLEAGRRLEIDNLNGWVASRARRLGVSAPRNRRLAQVLASERSRQLLGLQRSIRTAAIEQL